MTCDKSQLFNFGESDSSNEAIHLPNGATSPITHCETCRHGDILRLDLVLYAFVFHYNLLLVSQLSKELAIIVVFLPNMVVL